MIIKMLKLRRSEFVMTTVIALAAFVFGAGILAVALNVSSSEETTFEIGTIMALMVILFVSIFLGASLFVNNFNVSVGMGVTRKQFMISYGVSSVIYMGVQLVIVYALHFIETAEIAVFYSQYEKETGPEAFLFSAYIIPLMFLVIGIQMFFGIMSLKFGKKAFWVIWAIWMIVCFLPSRVTNAVENAPDSILGRFGDGIVQFVKGFTPVTGSIVLLVLAVVFAAGAFVCSRKQAVKQF